MTFNGLMHVMEMLIQCNENIGAISITNIRHTNASLIISIKRRKIISKAIQYFLLQFSMISGRKAVRINIVANNLIKIVSQLAGINIGSFIYIGSSSCGRKKCGDKIVD